MRCGVRIVDLVNRVSWNLNANTSGSLRETGTDNEMMKEYMLPTKRLLYHNITMTMALEIRSSLLGEINGFRSPHLASQEIRPAKHNNHPYLPYTCLNWNRYRWDDRGWNTNREIDPSQDQDHRLLVAEIEKI